MACLPCVDSVVAGSIQDEKTPPRPQETYQVLSNNNNQNPHQYSVYVCPIKDKWQQNTIGKDMSQISYYSQKWGGPHMTLMGFSTKQQYNPTSLKQLLSSISKSTLEKSPYSSPKPWKPIITSLIARKRLVLFGTVHTPVPFFVLFLCTAALFRVRTFVPYSN